MKVRYVVAVAMILACSVAVQAAEQEELAFENDGLKISGTLNMPEGDGPFAVAVLIHGSGPNDRHQSVILNDPNAKCLYPELFGDTIAIFDDIATALTDAGMAVYQYEKRSREHAMSLDQNTVTPHDFVNDAVAAGKMLSARKDIDPNKVVFIGHSQGANFVHLAAEKLGSAPAVIMLAGPAEPIDKVIIQQIDKIMRKCVNDEQAVSTTEQMTEAFAKLRSGEFPASSPLMGAYPTFWNDWIELTENALKTVEASTLPTLIAGGLDDLNVPAHNLEMFKKVNNDKLTVKSYAGLNHMLTEKDNNRVDAQLLADMVRWLQSVDVIN